MIRPHWGDCTHHAGANDADFAFDAAPQTDIGVVVGRVCDLADPRRVLQTHHAACSHEESNEERQDNANFPSLILNLDLHQFRDREEEDDQVEENVDGAVNVDSELEVVAVAFVFSVPLFPEKSAEITLATFYMVRRVKSVSVNLR